MSFNLCSGVSCLCNHLARNSEQQVLCDNFVQQGEGNLWEMNAGTAEMNFERRYAL